MKRIPLKSRVRRAIYSATVLAFYRRLLTQFERQAAAGQTLQNGALLSWIDRCRDTEFGRRHNFEKISCVGDFRRNVPISNYEDLQPDLSAVAEGNFSALLPAKEKLHAFACTSGSSGKPKILPVTQTWLRQYQKQWRIWGAKAVSDNTMLTTKKWLQISGPLNIDRSASNHQVGMVSAITAHHQNPLLRSFFATPPHFSDVLDPQIRSYLILRLAMPADIGFIITTTATNLIKLAEAGNTFKESLIRDFHDGTCSYGLAEISYIAPELSRRLQRKSRRFARELEALAANHSVLHPKHYWQLELLSCWIGGTIGYQSAALEECFGAVPLRDIGYISTEGRHTITLNIDDPSGVLVSDAFYEFECTATGDLMLASELDVGGEYTVIVTAANGLYRFRLEDIIRCTGYLGELPQLLFVQKSAQFSDIEGEKISASQMSEAVAQAMRDHKLVVTSFSALADRDAAQGPRYVLLIETSESPHADLMAELARRIDELLVRMNIMYQQKRSDGSLGPVQVQCLRRGTWSDYGERKGRERTTGDTQFKLPPLMPGVSLQTFRDEIGADCWDDNS